MNHSSMLYYVDLFSILCLDWLAFPLLFLCNSHARLMGRLHWAYQWKCRILMKSALHRNVCIWETHWTMRNVVTMQTDGLKKTGPWEVLLAAYTHTRAQWKESNFWIVVMKKKTSPWLPAFVWKNKKQVTNLLLNGQEIVIQLLSSFFSAKCGISCFSYTS